MVSQTLPINEEVKNAPKLRFPGFTGKWEEKRFGDFLDLKNRGVPKPKDPYKAIGIRSHFKGTFQKLESDPSKIAMDHLFVVKENDFIVNITFAWEGAVAVVSKDDEGGLVSHRFPTFEFNKKVTDANFFRFVYPTRKMQYLLKVISPGGAGRNRVLDKKDLLDITIRLPSISEQQKIAAFLSTVDEWISNLRNQKEALQEYKKGVAKKVFSQEIRFKDGSERNFPKWEEKTLGECLNYEQPTKYIVTSTQYSDTNKIPVLTPGKSFILGYTSETEGVYSGPLPVIVFDDFTTATQFVDFKFKVKSSAIKILHAKNGHNIQFIYEALRQIKYQVGGHGRHWISKYSKIKIPLPTFLEQQKIADILMSLDKLIENKELQIKHAEKWKKGLMQGLFV